MPSIALRVPFAVTCERDGLVVATPLPMLDVCTVAGSKTVAIRMAVKRLQVQLNGELPQNVARYGVEAEIDQRVVKLELAPPKSWRDRPNITLRNPITIPLLTFGWTCGPNLVYAVAPQYHAQVIALDRDEADCLLIKQIRHSVSASLTEDPGFLAGLVVRRLGEAEVVWQTVEVEIAGLGEQSHESTENQLDTLKTLQQVATRWIPNKLRPVFHRERLVNGLLEWIVGDDRRSVVLVGRSGVGKTAIVHAAIRDCQHTGTSPPKFYATDGSRLIAGQCGFGMLQKQCLDMASEAERANAIVHLGNLSPLIESGKINGSGGCASILTPRIASGRLTVIIESTPEEYAIAQRTEPRLMAALETFHVDEPDAETVRKILADTALAWRMKVDPDALVAIDQLHRRFPTDSAVPGRPLAFLSSLVSEVSGDEALNTKQVNAAFSRQTGLPSFLIDSACRPDLNEIRRTLNNEVIGQPHAVEAVVDTLATLATSLSRGDRPLASLLLIGPTGVGKTETAKAIARMVYRDPSRMIRIDMSEFSTPDASRRLIGDSSSGDGVLTGAIRAQPFSLLLLDEFEKADRGVFDLLLQVLGEGRLTDARGRLADFRNSIVLMTSNLGVESYRDTSIGLVVSREGDAKRLENHFEQQVRAFLRPELYNRIDRVLAYQALDPATIREIAANRLSQIEQRDGMVDVGGRFRVDDEAMDRLVEMGYEPQYGARPLARTMERHIVSPLAESLCESRSRHSPLVRVEAKELGLRVTVDTPAADGRHDLAGEVKQASLLSIATQTRRFYQTLLRSPTLLSLQSRAIKNRRTLEYQLHRAKSELQRSRLLSMPLAQSVHRDESELLRVTQLGDEIIKQERLIALSHFRNRLTSPEIFHDDLVNTRERFFDVVIGLLDESLAIDRPITLYCFSRDLAVFRATLDAYFLLARQNRWETNLYILLQPHEVEQLRNHQNRPPFVSSLKEHAFVVDPLESPAKSKTNVGSIADAPDGTKPFFAFEYPAETENFMIPDTWRRLLIEFVGYRSAVMMTGETGTHTFLPDGETDKKRIKLMTVAALHGSARTAQDLQSWLFEQSTKSISIRRQHDASKQSIRDVRLGKTFHYRSHPDARIAHALSDTLHQDILQLISDETEIEAAVE